MPALATQPASRRAASDAALPLVIRFQDGREEEIERPAGRHRAIHLGALHTNTNGFVEIAAGRRDEAGELAIYTRQFASHFLPGGGCANTAWRTPLLALAERHHAAGEEVFIGVAPRAARRGAKECVHWTRWLWMDIDRPGHEAEIDELLVRFPAHLEIASAGGHGDERADGHRHLMWMLARPQVARTVTDRQTGEMFLNPVEVKQGNGGPGRPRIVGYRDLKTHRLVTNAECVDWIERWNLRLIHRLGKTQRDGRGQYIADKQCRERARVLRLAGTINRKTGRYARIARIDLALAPYDVNDLVGQLPDPRFSRPVKQRDLREHAYDPYRLIPAAVYFPLFCGTEIPAAGNVHCPSPTHPDVKESCSVDEYVFHCFGCGAQGTIYDLWSLLTRGVTGDALSSDKTLFHIVASEVREQCRQLI